MLGTAEQNSFVSRSVNAVVTTLRANGSPSNSMVTFARREDRLFFSTTMHRLKGKTLVRDPRASLTILNPLEPWSFVSVEGRVIIHRGNPMELRDLILDNCTGQPGSVGSREQIGRMIAEPDRAVFELEPTRVSGFMHG
jgi:PPOX class probable F420-dependent enzyme